MIPFRVTYYSKLVVDFICEDETAVRTVRTKITTFGKPRKLEFTRGSPSAHEVQEARKNGQYIANI